MAFRIHLTQPNGRIWKLDCIYNEPLPRPGEEIVARVGLRSMRAVVTAVHERAEVYRPRRTALLRRLMNLARRRRNGIVLDVVEAKTGDRFQALPA